MKALDTQLHRAILENVNNENFDALALEVFFYQAANNPIYASFLSHLRKPIESIQSIQEIPFLPISFFKYHTIQTGNWQAVNIFQSSGTTNTGNSQHLLRNATWYKDLAAKGIQEQYGIAIEDFCTVALLPSYMERGQSSLVFMVEDFVKRSKYKEGGFFLQNTAALAELLQYNASHNIPTLFFGVSYALLDFADAFPMDLAPNIHIMETGGMKGRRKEMTKSALHTILKNAFPLANIDSEYGMTELISQAYMTNGKDFKPNSTMKVLLRDATDPLHILDKLNKTGGINIIDLGNIDTIAFIATDDLGKITDKADNRFEVIGRFDAADIRGCNLLLDI